MKHLCPICSEYVNGRVDKVYCSNKCKTRACRERKALQNADDKNIKDLMAVFEQEGLI